jgi:hypothetical protein
MPHDRTTGRPSLGDVHRPAALHENVWGKLPSNTRHPQNPQSNFVSTILRSTATSKLRRSCRSCLVCQVLGIIAKPKGPSISVDLTQVV